jgi:hypothetical protein
MFADRLYEHLLQISFENTLENVPNCTTRNLQKWAITFVINLCIDEWKLEVSGVIWRHKRTKFYHNWLKHLYSYNELSVRMNFT